MKNGNRTSYEDLLKNVSAVILPLERIKAEYSDIPYRSIEDMGVIYRADGEVITNQDLADLGITSEQFQKDAIQAAAVNHPCQLIPIDEAVGMPAGFMKPPYYVATNDILDHGASVIAYPDFLKKAEKVSEGEFYVLPSSIHEVIIFPVSAGLSADNLNEIVRSANAACVAPDEQLSDHAYRYDSHTRQLVSCGDTISDKKQMNPDLQKFIKAELKDDLENKRINENEYRYLSRNVEKMSTAVSEHSENSLHDQYATIKRAMLIAAGFTAEDGLENSMQMNAPDLSGPFSM